MRRGDSRAHQSLEQAALVATHQAENVDWKEIENWVVREGMATSYRVVDFYEE